MLELLPLERTLFLGVLVLSVISSVLAYIQIVKEDVKFRQALITFTVVQITLSIALLILRAVSIKAFPITGVFESMLILMVFIGITFLFLSTFLQQVWFLSVMAWVLCVVSFLAVVVAKPASVLQAEARTLWVIIHAISMALSGAMIVFAAAMSVLFLWSRMRLRSSKFLKLFGKMPDIEKLQSLNLLGLRLSFAALTLGLISGIGMVAVKGTELGMTPVDWLTDSKIVLIAVAWIILICTLVLKYVLAFSGKAVAQATLIVCFLILFAFVGSKIFCKSGHDFESRSANHHIQVESLLCK